MVGPLALPDAPWQIIVCVGTIISIVSAGFLIYEYRHLARAGRVTALVGMMIFGLSFVACTAWYFWPSKTILTLVFPDDANTSDAPPTNYAIHIPISTNGGRADDFVSMHTFMFGVVSSTKVSIRDMKADLVRVIYIGGITDSVKIPLTPTKPSTAALVRPSDTVFFHLLEFVDDRPYYPLAPLMIVSPERINTLKLGSKQGVAILNNEIWNLFMAVPVLGGYGISKPTHKSTIYLDIAIYASNIEPTYARFSLTGDGPIALKLIWQGG